MGNNTPVYGPCFTTSQTTVTGVLQFTYGKNYLTEGRAWTCGLIATFWSRIMNSRGIELKNTVFGVYFGLGKKNTFSPRT
jgi:hypothetical protein